MTALDEQVGGSHYKDFAIQPVEFIHKNKLGFIQGNIVKYICRYESKGGIEDIKKVKHYAELLIELSKSNEHECDYTFISVNGQERCICGAVKI